MKASRPRPDSENRDDQLSGGGATKRPFRRGVSLATAATLSAMLFTQSAVAQTGIATEICTSEQYGVVLGTAAMFTGICVLAIFASIFGGAGAFSFSWASRALSKIGASGMLYGLAAIVVLSLTLLIAGIGFGTLDFAVPSECYFGF